MNGEVIWQASDFSLYLKSSMTVRLKQFNCLYYGLFFSILFVSKHTWEITMSYLRRRLLKNSDIKV